MELYKGARVRLKSVEELCAAYAYEYDVSGNLGWIMTSPIIVESMMKYLNTDQIIKEVYLDDEDPSFTIVSDELGFYYPLVSIAEVYDD